MSGSDSHQALAGRAPLPPGRSMEDTENSTSRPSAKPVKGDYRGRADRKRSPSPRSRGKQDSFSSRYDDRGNGNRGANTFRNEDRGSYQPSSQKKGNYTGPSSRQSSDRRDDHPNDRRYNSNQRDSDRYRNIDRDTHGQREDRFAKQREPPAASTSRIDYRTGDRRSREDGGLAEGGQTNGGAASHKGGPQENENSGQAAEDGESSSKRPRLEDTDPTSSVRSSHPSSSRAPSSSKPKGVYERPVDRDRTRDAGRDRGSHDDRDKERQRQRERERERQSVTSSATKKIYERPGRRGSSSPPQRNERRQDKRKTSRSRSRERRRSVSPASSLRSNRKQDDTKRYNRRRDSRSPSRSRSPSQEKSLHNGRRGRSRSKTPVGDGNRRDRSRSIESTRSSTRRRSRSPVSTDRRQRRDHDRRSNNDRPIVKLKKWPPSPEPPRRKWPPSPEPPKRRLPHNQNRNRRASPTYNNFEVPLQDEPERKFEGPESQEDGPDVSKPHDSSWKTEATDSWADWQPSEQAPHQQAFYPPQQPPQYQQTPPQYQQVPVPPMHPNMNMPPNQHNPQQPVPIPPIPPPGFVMPPPQQPQNAHSGYYIPPNQLPIPAFPPPLPPHAMNHHQSMPMPPPMAIPLGQQSPPSGEPRQLSLGIRAPPPGPNKTGKGGFRPVAGFVPIATTQTNANAVNLNLRKFFPGDDSEPSTPISGLPPMDAMPGPMDVDHVPSQRPGSEGFDSPHARLPQALYGQGTPQHQQEGQSMQATPQAQHIILPSAHAPIFPALLSNIQANTQGSPQSTANQNPTTPPINLPAKPSFAGANPSSNAPPSSLPSKPTYKPQTPSSSTAALPALPPSFPMPPSATPANAVLMSAGLPTDPSLNAPPLSDTQQKGSGIDQQQVNEGTTVDLSSLPPTQLPHLPEAQRSAAPTPPGVGVGPAVATSASANSTAATTPAAGDGVIMPPLNVTTPATEVPPTKPISDELYERLAQVGEGTYGKVYKARNQETGQLVGLKRIRMEAEKDGFPVTSIREIKLLQSLDHENVIKLQEMMVSKGHVYMVFDYLDHDLTGILLHPGVSFTPGNLKSLMGQFLRGLDYIHWRGVLHRDLKGSNILLSKHGELKIADFGLAKFYDKYKKNDLTNRVITQWYKPPELLFGETVYGVEVDMWSAGCIFLELFTKRPVFQGQDEIHQLDVIYKLMGTPNEQDWPEVKSLPWYELVKPKHVVESTFRSVFSNILKSEAALDLAAALLSLNPSKRPTAQQALQYPYFTSEEPQEEMPTWLEEVKGDWHEMESKEASRRKGREVRKAQQQAQAQAQADAQAQAQAQMQSENGT